MTKPKEKPVLYMCEECGKILSKDLSEHHSCVQYLASKILFLQEQFNEFQVRIASQFRKLE